MKNALAIFFAAACLARAALAVTMASQPWVTNRIAEAEARTDAKIISATNAIPAPVVDLTPATNYTDAVALDFEDGRRTVHNSDNSTFSQIAYELGDTEKSYTAQGLITASTNAAIAVAASKQDALPYPTNAIPYAAISGGPEWRVVEVDENTPVAFVTNGIVAKLINGELYASATGWPDGAAMFVRGSVVIPQYEVDEQLRLVGYGTWPTNGFQSVWWRSGATIYVNILVEE